MDRKVRRIEGTLAVQSKLEELLQEEIFTIIDAVSETFELEWTAVMECVTSAVTAGPEDQPSPPREPPAPKGAGTPARKGTGRTSTKPKPPATKKSSTAGVGEVCRGVLKKGGECGKKASHELGGSWYCGVHRPDKPTKTRSSKEDNTRDANTKKLPSKKGTMKENATLAQQRLDKLLSKRVVHSDIELVKENGRTIDKTTRICFDGTKVYGKLDKDGETILPLDDEDNATVDYWGVEVKAIPLKLDEDVDDIDEPTPEGDATEEEQVPLDGDDGEEEITF